MARIELKVALKKHATPKPDPENFKFFCEQLKKLEKEVSTSSSIDESEENVKKDINDFLSECFYKETNYINTRNNIDSAIYKTQDKNSPIQVLIEAKRPEKNGNQFPTEQDLNKKALQETVLYYLQERDNDNDRPNDDLKHIVITNGLEWFLFDASEFETYFNKNRELLNRYSEHKAKSLPDNSREYFYKNFAATAINEVKDKLNYIYFDIKKLKGKGDLIAIYNILSPYYLLKKTYVPDSNTLNQKFYDELLHIIGLKEAKDKETSKKVIVRPEDGREEGSLLENTISKLMQNPYGDYGNNLFENALQQVIVWINRILFLKLLEAQLVKWNGNDKSYKFMTTDNLKDYGDLNDLFFGVLAFQPDKRPNSILKEKYHNVPYLNSSLFEKQQKELSISNLTNGLEITVFKKSVLKGERGKPMNALRYLLLFLDAFDFGAVDSDNENITNADTLINASVLGLIFEKINGYKDGSYFTPGFITQYMCREAIQRAVVQKFNEAKGWGCSSFSELKEWVHTELLDKNMDRKEANQIINSLRICDPAVGSGHFLVSALNEIIAIKAELRVLQQNDGSKLNYSVIVENDELVVRDEDGKVFSYKPNSKNSENQKVQESLFEEKRAIIENCLFGVDINPNSVNICQLRLWIELLKNAYYHSDGTLETLPNIDINIKCGNSLICKYPIKIGQSIVNDDIKNDIEAYKNAVSDYKKESNKLAKHEVEVKIAAIKKKFTGGIQFDLFDDSIREKAIADSIYRNSLEWMIEFPEVLDVNGNFLGFDVVIGNPPYIPSKYVDKSEKKLYKKTFNITDSQVDLYSVFIGLSNRITKNDAFVSLIVPDSIIGRKNFEGTRKSIVCDRTIINWIHIDKVFKNVGVSSLIFLMQNKAQDDYSFCYIKAKTAMDWLKGKTNSVSKKKSTIEKTSYCNVTFINESEALVLDKINKNEKMSKHIIWRGEEIGKDSPLIKKQMDPNDLPIIVGDDVHRYKDVKAIRYIAAKDVEKKNYDKPKIVIRQLGECINAALDFDGNINVQAVYNLALENDDVDYLKFLLGLLNSKLYHFIYGSISGDKLSFTRLILDNVKALPIPPATTDQQRQIAAFVDQIFADKKQDPETESALEHEIDLLVYHLYGLTYDEAKMIDEKITEEDFAAAK